jgi:hypothetical protein
MNSTNLSENKPCKRRNWWTLWQWRRQPRDPMLVFNMSIFNFDPAWNRIFTPVKHRENVWA